MGAAADDVAIGSLEDAMVADLSEAGGFGGENGAKEIVQTTALGLLSINIMEEDGAAAANDCCSGVFPFAHQRALHGFKGQFFDFCYHLAIFWDVIMQQL